MSENPYILLVTNVVTLTVSSKMKLLRKIYCSTKQTQRPNYDSRLPRQNCPAYCKQLFLIMKTQSYTCLSMFPNVFICYLRRYKKGFCLQYVFKVGFMFAS